MTAKHTFPARTAELEALGGFVQQHGLGPLVELGVTELVTNAILHGGARCIRVRVDPASGQLWVYDNGLGFNPLEAQPRPMGELREGGYGVAIIHKVFRNLRYCRRRGWNCIRARFGEVEK